MSEKGYFFMLLVSFSVADIPIPPSGFFQKSNRNNKNTDVIIIHKCCSNLDNGCKVKEKRCNCKIFVRIIAEKISKIKKWEMSIPVLLAWFETVTSSIEILKEFSAFIAPTATSILQKQRRMNLKKFISHLYLKNIVVLSFIFIGLWVNWNLSCSFASVAKMGCTYGKKP